MEKFNNRYRIPSARAQWHDYNSGVYFVTICTKKREHYFGEIVGTMQLSDIGRYTDECILKMESLHTGISVPLYQIMPNHIHLIVIVETSYYGVSTARHDIAETSQCGIVETSQCGIAETSHCGVSTTTTDGAKSEMMRDIAQQCGRLSYIISQFKSAVTKYARQQGMDFAWQTRFYDRIVRNQNEFDRISNYIVKNHYCPVKVDKLFFEIIEI